MKRTQTDAGAAAVLDRETEIRIVEALIFVADSPLTIEQMGQVITGRSAEELRALVDALDRELRSSDRAIRVEEVAGGFRFVTRPEYAGWVRTHFRNRNRARLSPAGIETLAVIAYKQPVTAPEIQEIRGVDSQGAIKTLLEKRLVRMAGKKKVVGRPFLYATTREFLMHFGLASIEDLPPIEDFEALATAIEPAEVESHELLSGDKETTDTEFAGSDELLPGEPEVTDTEFAGEEDGPATRTAWGGGRAAGETTPHLDHSRSPADLTPEHNEEE